jgi:hypothetical protein
MRTYADISGHPDVELKLHTNGLKGSEGTLS